MTLGEYISLLEKVRDKHLPIEKGLGELDSWRGSYDELCLFPVDNTTVDAMLADAREALNKTFYGYKGGEFTMGLHTEVHIEVCYSSYTDGGFAAEFIGQLDDSIVTEARQEEWLVRKAVMLVLASAKSF